MHERHPNHWDLSRELQNGFTAGALASASTDSRVDALAAASAVQAEKLGAATAVQAEKLGSAIQVQGNLNTSAIQQNALMFANQSTVQVERVRAELGLQLQTVAAAAELRAQNIASCATAKLAECCCDIKSLIREDGDKTRALVQGIERDALRAELTESRIVERLERRCCGRRGGDEGHGEH